MMNNEKHDLVILYSGGADSRLLLELAIANEMNPYCLMIDYEQLHKHELRIAQELLDSKQISYQTIKVNNLQVNSGLTGNGIKNTSGKVHEMHVPGRNSIFLSLAYSIAESKDIDTIWIGCDYSDAINLFPDCKQDYILRMNSVFSIAGPKSIKVEAPFLGFTKELVLRTLKYMGINDDELFSGYGVL